MDETFIIGVGMKAKRNEVVQGELTRRMDVLQEMDTRHLIYTAEGNVEKLIELATEYELLGALNTATRIRKQCSNI